MPSEKPIAFEATYGIAYHTGRRVLLGDLRRNVVIRLGMPIVLQRPSFHPPVPQRSVGHVPDTRRSLHLGVEVAVVDVSGRLRNPPELGFDLLEGRVQGVGPVHGHPAAFSVPLRLTQPVIGIVDDLGNRVPITVDPFLHQMGFRLRGDQAGADGVTLDQLV